MYIMKQLLTIAGSDASGGAGIQADLKTFAALGCYGMSVVCAVTAQNTQAVLHVHPIPEENIALQIEGIFQDIRVDGVKIGMVGNSAAIRTVAQHLRLYRPPLVVLDPVMVSKSGYPLLDPQARQVLVDELFPLADLITPNIYEAEVLTGESIQNIQNMERAAHKLLSLGPRAVLLKGGHLTDRCDDLLMTSSSIKVFPGVRIASIHTHGTGCSLSSAITALWAREIPLEQAVAEAKAWLTEAIIEGIPLGKGHGPVHHFHAFYDREGLPRQKRQ